MMGLTSQMRGRHVSSDKAPVSNVPRPREELHLFQSPQGSVAFLRAYGLASHSVFSVSAAFLTPAITDKRGSILPLATTT